MDELQKRGDKLIYDPKLIVHRRPRRSLKAFARMLLTYGRGRAEQFRLHPTFGSTLNFVPPLFLVYLAALPFLIALLPFGKFGLIPLTFYVLALGLQTVALAGRGRVTGAIAAAPLIVLSHLCYGWGFWRGLFTKLTPRGQRANVKVTLEKISW